MATPSDVSDALWRLARSMDGPDPLSRTRVASELSRIAAELDGPRGPVKLRLVSTEPSSDETADETTFYQEWVITLPDGTKVQTSTDVGWGQEPSGIPHGDMEIEVCGHVLTVEQILGFVISTGDGPVEDGEEVPLDGDWCSRMAEVGHIP